MIPSGEGQPGDRVPLSCLSDGTRARLVVVDAGAGLRSRLTAMGLRPGVEVKVVNNRGAGPFVVAVQGMRIVLGRGMAHKVFVVPLRQGAEETEGPSNRGT